VTVTLAFETIHLFRKAIDDILVDEAQSDSAIEHDFLEQSMLPVNDRPPRKALDDFDLRIGGELQQFPLLTHTNVKVVEDRLMVSQLQHRSRGECHAAGGDVFEVSESSMSLPMISFTKRFQGTKSSFE
jgi:hypothetical protein